jgi:hypothetical protein
MDRNTRNSGQYRNTRNSGQTQNEDKQTQSQNRILKRWTTGTLPNV